MQQSTSTRLMPQGSTTAPGMTTIPLCNDPRLCSLRERRISRWGRGRKSASRSLPRFYTSSPGTAICSAAIPNSSMSTPDNIAVTSLASISDAAGCDEKIVTVVDIREHSVDNDANTRDNEPSYLEDVQEGSNRGCLSSKLRKLLLPCFPQNEVFGDSDSSYEDQRDSDHNGEDIVTQIECILGQHLKKGTSEDLPTTSLQVDTHYPLHVNKLPRVSDWIQNPLLLTATPGSSGMCVRRIRQTWEKSYFDTPESNHSDTFDINQIIQLPINNGKEHPSNVRVIDFETKLFAGTALFRIRGCNGWKSAGDVGCDSSTHDYFANQNRKFQMVIRGKFKSKVIMADCMSGLLLDHQLITSSSMNCVDGLSCSDEYEPCDKRNDVQKSKRGKSSRKDGLPSKLALRTAVKVAGVFSPRMDADLECTSPRILSPLCSTAQTINVIRDGCISPRLEAFHAEPVVQSTASLVNDLCQSTTKYPNTSSTNSVQYRKSAFDVVYDAHASSYSSPCFDQDAEYTFEFLQHLIDYNDLSLDCGKVIGKIKLGGALRGQPVRFVSVVKQGRTNESGGESMNMDQFGCLWSFDMWHKCLLPSR